MTIRIATLNIRHGGSKFSDALSTRLLGYDADLLVVTEFRANEAGTTLVAQLEDAGYTTTHPMAEPKQNTVLIASRSPIDRAAPFTRDLPGRHLWCAEFDGTLVCGVYLPQAHAKLPYWEALIDRARRSGVDLLIGDFNTGNNDLDKEPKGTKFIGPETPGRLIATGYTDVWRSLHPTAREYSWFSRPGDNGFRLDYIFAAPEFAERVVACEFDHAPRLARETDHSALVASFN
ncbi:endonuclease/exonuclease/phosphatase family protein [Mycolicibacterium alvei]|uniref:Endonuclease n=1 Tax=Mycolicibacterium alvei TaxID=67081 RepID=A0A6N4UUQ3_9MYCO|nr:endonuclease/exonuclease/phosphatase family protein [Mycolicibacterium alvei]MCV7002247.1 endonuclease/exonuclease/phosphatase family protein [Mycolicibacterium alvei]BBX27407.1 endonuclease [Mycolicibacterium alvei]